MECNTAVGEPHRPDGETGWRAVAPATVAASALRWWQVFPGEARQLGVVRRWLASLLPECPARDAVISIATELGSNALLHTASGRSGLFAVEVTWQESVVRVVVADGGSPTEPHVIEDRAAEHGRGLLLVRGLSLRSGVTGDHRGRLVWADIAWDGRNPAARVLSRDPDATTSHDGPDRPDLALRRSAGPVRAWPAGMVSAGRPDELVVEPSTQGWSARGQDGA